MAIEDSAHHFPVFLQPDDAHDVSRYLLRECPVAHSDADGGFWVVNRHADLLQVMQDSVGFASGNRGVRVPHDPAGVNRPPMPPIDSNPPLHRQVRAVMNPFLSPKALVPHEPGFRSIIGGLIDRFVLDGHCDLADQLAKIFPAQITSQELLGVTDPIEQSNLREWNRRLSYDLYTDPPEVMAAIQDEFSAWAQELVDKRRAEPGEDMVSALVQATVDGQPLLSDLELVGAIVILVSGGFSTTAEAACNIVLRLTEDPDLEPALREDPSRIPDAIEEVLRVDPPVSTRPRRATADIEVGGQMIHRDDRVLCNYLAANFDPAEWDNPEEFIMGRAKNRMVTFGVGPHRCLGSHMARISLRIMLEELLKRITDIRLSQDQPLRRITIGPGGWRRIDSLPITFAQADNDHAAAI